MADVTNVPDLQFAQWSRPGAENPRLAAPISSTDTTITVTNPLLDKDGLIVSKAFLMGIKTDGYTEHIYVPANGIQGNGNAPDSTNLGTTISGVTRGVQIAASLDIETEVNGLAIAHKTGSPVYVNIAASIMQIVWDVLRGNLGTGAQSLEIGDGAKAANQFFLVDAGGANPVGFGVDTSGNPIIQQEDGSTFIPGAGVGSITGGDGIDITSSVVSVDTADTTTFVKTSSGAGDEDKVPVLDASGQLDTGFIQPAGLSTYISDVTATATEINQALDGISANVTDTNLNTLTAGTTSDADALHTHTGLPIATGGFFKTGSSAGDQDETVSIDAGFTAGKIVMHASVFAYGNTSIVYYKATYIYDGTTFVSQDYMGNTGTSGGSTASSQALIGSGATRRDVTITVNSISGGDGNDVVIRTNFADTGSPGSNKSGVRVSYEIYSN